MGVHHRRLLVPDHLREELETAMVEIVDGSVVGREHPGDGLGGRSIAAPRVADVDGKRPDGPLPEAVHEAHDRSGVDAAAQHDTDIAVTGAAGDRLLKCLEVAALERVQIGALVHPRASLPVALDRDRIPASLEVRAGFEHAHVRHHRSRADRMAEHEHVVERRRVELPRDALVRQDCLEAGAEREEPGSPAVVHRLHARAAVREQHEVAVGAIPDHRVEESEGRGGSGHATRLHERCQEIGVLRGTAPDPRAEARH